MKAECHDTFVSNCLELCAIIIIMSPPLSACLQACVYSVYSEARKYRRYFLPASQDVLTLCPVINFIDLYILLVSSSLPLFLCKNKNIKYEIF